MDTFRVGDRVRVADDYFLDYLRGAVGTIATLDPSVQRDVPPGVYWVEFDEMQPDENGELTEASEVSGLDLRPN